MLFSAWMPPRIRNSLVRILNLNKGDITRVKLLSIDERGRLRLSRKAALAEDAAAGTDDGGTDTDEGQSEEAQG